jgi:methylmalonyl-CoA/ethylmalonyl-CoA epimerase
MEPGTLNGVMEEGVAGSADKKADFLTSQSAVLHHLGFVVRSIASVAEEYAASIAARWDGEIIHDPIQHVRVAFFSPVDSRNPVYELVEPASDDSPITDFLKKRGGLHHVCYEVNDLDAALESARLTGWAIASSPAPAVAFNNRRIAWIVSRTRLLVELLERQPK